MKNQTAKKIVLTACVAVYGVLVPVLELNNTHVFNPLWPSHARLHEVWQLLTNSALAGIVLWLAWSRGKIRTAAGLGMVPPAGFLAAFALAGFYGGSMRHTDGTELTLLGVNASGLIMSLAVTVLLYIAMTPSRNQLRKKLV
ncbi:hypothetical protein [Allopontixanthobacter sp.]|uniref:hypothetical protein n=1 Tax=Allopontixanthobacter sp. TaxID=2906452 RepID=UPI002AC8FD4B|nr:hypothetical protein [Allopontixanthobacter sp.]